MKTAKLATLSALVVSAALAAGACTNPETPAGHEGYVYHVPLVWGKMDYRDTMQGPASTGLSWRLYVTNIDMRAMSYAEHFQLLTADNLNIEFEVNTRLRLRPGSSKEIVERWGGSDWYEWNVKEPLRTRVRRRVTEVSASEIQVATERVRDRIREDLEARFDETPVEVLSVDIGAIHFPQEMMGAIQEKISAQQELQRQQFVLAMTRKEAAIRVLEALRVANQQQIISATLDPLYVQRKAVQVYRQLAEGPNETVVVLPNMPEGTGLPKVLTRGERRPLTDADRTLLEEMEERYMQIAEMDIEEIVDDPDLEVPESFDEGAFDEGIDEAPTDSAPELPADDGAGVDAESDEAQDDGE
jgi:regulator of protease activity HflC (stomatin/prohibitin superfamily)